MRLCIDTNAYSMLLKGDREIKELMETADEILVPAVVLGELYAGFHMGRRSKKNIDELKRFLERPGVRVAPIDSATAERYGFLVKALREIGTPLPTNDIWIAAVTFETGARLLTRDQHFKRIPGLLSLWRD